MAEFTVAWALSGTSVVEAENEREACEIKGYELEDLGLPGGEYARLAVHGSARVYRNIFEGNPGDIQGLDDMPRRREDG